jgi:hypothetical protein
MTDTQTLVPARQLAATIKARFPNESTDSWPSLRPSPTSWGVLPAIVFTPGVCRAPRCAGRCANWWHTAARTNTDR